MDSKCKAHTLLQALPEIQNMLVSWLIPLDQEQLKIGMLLILIIQLIHLWMLISLAEASWKETQDLLEEEGTWIPTKLFRVWEHQQLECNLKLTIALLISKMMMREQPKTKNLVRAKLSRERSYKKHRELQEHRQEEVPLKMRKKIVFQLWVNKRTPKTIVNLFCLRCQEIVTNYYYLIKSYARSSETSEKVPHGF